MEIAQNFMGPLAKNTMTRINENGNVVGTIIVNCEGFPETTTLDSLTAATYSTHMRNLSHAASNALKEIVSDLAIFAKDTWLTCSQLYAAVAQNGSWPPKQEKDVLDELVVLRLVSKKTEAVVAPDHEFHLIVVMRKS